MHSKNRFWFWGLLISALSWADDCSQGWQSYLNTDPLHTQIISGDSNAAYLMYGFAANRRRAFRLRGNFPKARFMSLEAYRGRVLQRDGDWIFDYEIEASPGSVNPFQEASRRGQTFEINVVPKGRLPQISNRVEMPQDGEVHVLMMRIYSPHKGVTLTAADVPLIEAYDVETGRPMSCPTTHPIPVMWNIPQALATTYAHFKPFEFKLKDIGIGGNNAIPGYGYAFTNMTHQQVALVRVKVPVSASHLGYEVPLNSQTQVRYWSLCQQNFMNNQTLSCLPDFAAKVDKDGFIQVAVGNLRVQEAAEKWGYQFLEDKRGPKQKMMGFAYRNILPTAEFRATDLYRGDYLPKARLCAETDFIRGTCGF